MTINKTQENGRLILCLDGRLDTTTVPQLQEALIPAFDEAKEIIGIVYVSSAGLRVLLLAQKTSKSKGASMTLYGVSGGSWKSSK